MNGLNLQSQNRNSNVKYSWIIPYIVDTHPVLLKTVRGIVESSQFSKAYPPKDTFYRVHLLLVMDNKEIQDAEIEAVRGWSRVMGVSTVLKRSIPSSHLHGRLCRS